MMRNRESGVCGRKLIVGMSGIGLFIAGNIGVAAVLLIPHQGANPETNACRLADQVMYTSFTNADVRASVKRESHSDLQRDSTATSLAAHLEAAETVADLKKLAGRAQALETQALGTGIGHSEDAPAFRPEAFRQLVDAARIHIQGGNGSGAQDSHCVDVNCLMVVP